MKKLEDLKATGKVPKEVWRRGFENEAGGYLMDPKQTNRS